MQELVFLVLGILIGFFLHFAYRTLARGAKKTKNSKQIYQLVDTSLEEEEHWESESDDDSGFVRNSGPTVVEDKDLFAKYPIENIK